MLLDHLHIMFIISVTAHHDYAVLSFPYVRHVYHTHDAYHVIYYLPCKLCYVSNAFQIDNLDTS